MRTARAAPRSALATQGASPSGGAARTLRGLRARWARGYGVGEHVLQLGLHAVVGQIELRRVVVAEGGLDARLAVSLVLSRERRRDPVLGKPALDRRADSFGVLGRDGQAQRLSLLDLCVEAHVPRAPEEALEPALPLRPH